MEFFRRWFPPRADGPAAKGRGATPPDGNASELVLLRDEAARLLAEIDIDAVIAGHERWVPWLYQALQGVQDEQLRPEVISHDDCSELGQWLYGSGQQVLGHLPAFQMLVRRNRYFHQQAAALLTLQAAGDARQAQHAFKSCRHASSQMVLLLKELRRGLGRRQ